MVPEHNVLLNQCFFQEQNIYISSFEECFSLLKRFRKFQEQNVA